MQISPGKLPDYSVCRWCLKINTPLVELSTWPTSIPPTLGHAAPSVSPASGEDIQPFSKAALFFIIFCFPCIPHSQSVIKALSALQFVSHSWVNFVFPLCNSCLQPQSFAWLLLVFYCQSIPHCIHPTCWLRITSLKYRYSITNLPKIPNGYPKPPISSTATHSRESSFYHSILFDYYFCTYSTVCPY